MSDLHGGEEMMLENETSALNYVVINFITADRKKIIDPLKIFKPIGDFYQVNKPRLDGYILTSYRGKLEGVMKEESEQVELIYEPLGKLIIQSGIDEENTEVRSFQISERANQVKMISLPKIQGSEDYYYVEGHGDERQIGKRVINPDNFLPDDPTSDVYLVKLTLEQLDALEKRWHAQEQPVEAKPEIVSIKEKTAKEEAKVASVQEMPREEKVKVAEFTQKPKEEMNMQLLEPTLLLCDAFKQVTHALVEFDKKNQLSQLQRKQLIKKASALLVAIEKLSK